MKCYACGFESLPEFDEYIETFKTGKRKGQVKYRGVIKNANPQFREVLGVGGTEITLRTEDYYERFIPTKVWSCPQCGTMKVEI